MAAWDAAINVRGIYVGAIDPVTGNAVARDTGWGTASSLADANIVVDDNGSEIFVLHKLAGQIRSAGLAQRGGDDRPFRGAQAPDALERQ